MNCPPSVFLSRHQLLCVLERSIQKSFNLHFFVVDAEHDNAVNLWKRLGIETDVVTPLLRSSGLYRYSLTFRTHNIIAPLVDGLGHLAVGEKSHIQLTDAPN